MVTYNEAEYCHHQNIFRYNLAHDDNMKSGKALPVISICTAENNRQRSNNI